MDHQGKKGDTMNRPRDTQSEAEMETESTKRVHSEAEMEREVLKRRRRSKPEMEREVLERRRSSEAETEREVLKRRRRRLARYMEGKILVRRWYGPSENENFNGEISTEVVWTVIDWKKRDKPSLYRFDSSNIKMCSPRTSELMVQFPSNLGSIDDLTIAVWRYTIFYISGLLPYPSNGYTCSSRVFAYDVVKGQWDLDIPDIGQPRASHTATTVGNYIYVFGSVQCKRPKLNPCEWGECYDIKKKRWRYLPEPPQRLYELYQIRACAVYRNCDPFRYTPDTAPSHGSPLVEVEPGQTLILFPLPEPRDPICVFNCTTEKWMPDIFPTIPKSHKFLPIHPFAPVLSMQHDQLIVVDSVLLWHRRGHVYGYDFIHQGYTGSLLKLPRRLRGPSYACDCDKPADPAIYFFNPRPSLVIILYSNSSSSCCMMYCQFKVKRLGGSAGRVVARHELFDVMCTESSDEDMLLNAIIMCFMREEGASNFVGLVDNDYAGDSDDRKNTFMCLS